MGLVLHLPLTGDIHNQGLLEETVYKGESLTWSGEGKLGKCLQFNGDPKQILSFVNVPKKKNNFTWACWIKQINRTSTVYQKTTQYVLSMGRNCGAIGFNIRMINGYLNIHLGSGEDTDATTSTTNKGINIQELQLNTWYHICCIVDNESVNVYINGELIITFPLVEISYRSNYHGYFTVGKMGYDNKNTSAYFPFDGLIQDVRVYNTCLSSRQVKEISKGLICHYPLGEVDGKIGGRNLLRQSSLIGEQLMCNSITTMNSVTLRQYEEKGYHIIIPSEGNQNNGIGFDYNDFTSLNIKQGDTITFSCDIKGTSDSHKPNIIIRFQANSSSGVWWGNNAASSNPVYFVPSNDNWQRISVTYTIPNDEWASKTMWLAICGNYESNLYVRNLKLEKSSTATPWTPAPEDDTSFYDNVIYDTSGYCNNGSVTDSTCPTWSSDTPRYKGSYVFNENKQYVNCGVSTMIEGQEEITINCWAYMDDWTKFNARLFSCTENGGYNTEGVSSSIEFALNIYTTSDKSKYAYNSTTGGYPGIKLSDMSSGWHMITCVYKASVGDSMYLDGKLYEKKTYTSYGIHFNKNSYLFLGGESAGVNCIAPYFNGKLSDFRIYVTALDNQTIEELYKVGASVDNNGNLILAGEVIEE